MASACKFDSGNIDLVLMTYNREDTIGKALASVAGYRFNKVICVDHFSSDKTVEIVRRFYPNCEILYEDKGLGYARTIAIKKVESPSFLFLDSDVVLPSDFLARVSKFFVHSRVGAVQGKRHVKHELWGEVIRSRARRSEYRVLRRGDRPFTGATLIKTKAALGAELSKYKMWEDYFLMRHIQEKGYLWLEVFVPVETLEAKVMTYGGVPQRAVENEGAAMRLYGIKSPMAFLSEQLKYTLRDAGFAIKLGSLHWLMHVLELHRKIVKGYLSPTRYLS